MVGLALKILTKMVLSFPGGPMALPALLQPQVGSGCLSPEALNKLMRPGQLQIIVCNPTVPWIH